MVLRFWSYTFRSHTHLLPMAVAHFHEVKLMQFFFLLRSLRLLLLLGCNSSGRVQWTASTLVSSSPRICSWSFSMKWFRALHCAPFLCVCIPQPIHIIFRLRIFSRHFSRVLCSVILSILLLLFRAHSSSLYIHV